ncbi:J domain-containing protein [Arthrobacter sp. NPDC057013]|uniref:J domain-containing protein n=1 Tax=Arthrobacter sp. NPDC057013 TaxID=3345999 RepID=UPI003628F8EB
MWSGFPDHYGTLGVQRTATQQEISAAYRKFMRTHHPDMDSTSTDRTELLRIMEAFAVLRNPVKRAAYDKELGRRHAAAGSPKPARQNTNPEKSTAQEVPVRVVPHSGTEPPFRVTPVRWESGPSAGHRH